MGVAPGVAPGASPAPANNAPPTPQLDQDPPGAPAVTTSQQKALAIFDTARGLFKQGNYQLALAEANRAIALAPNDTLMHEFRALCMFSTQDYQQAAAAIYAVLSIGPGWDWATVSSLYADPNVYAEQLRALEKYCRDNPQTPHARFLLAYHYILTDHDTEAATELAAVVALQPKDQLSAQLLKGLTSTPADQPPAAPTTALPAPPAAPVEPSLVWGDWQSSRDDGSKFELSLTQENRFSWKVTQQGKEQLLSGTYTLANNYLILTASEQNALVGQVSIEPGDKLRFKLAGGAPNDPGLTFTHRR